MHQLVRVYVLEKMKTWFDFELVGIALTKPDAEELKEILLRDSTENCNIIITEQTIWLNLNTKEV